MVPPGAPILCGISLLMKGVGDVNEVGHSSSQGWSGGELLETKGSKLLSGGKCNKGRHLWPNFNV